MVFVRLQTYSRIGSYSMCLSRTGGNSSPVLGVRQLLGEAMDDFVSSDVEYETVWALMFKKRADARG
jgi:hypothetical protein